MPPNLHSTLLTTAQTWKQPKCPSTDGWIKKTWDIYTIGYYSALKKEQNFVICNNVDRLGGHYASKISQTEKDKYWISSLICGI